MLCNVCDDYQKRISQVEEKPPLDWFDAGRAGQGGGHREVDGGEHHHARDVHRDDQVIRAVSPVLIQMKICEPSFEALLPLCGWWPG